MCSTAGVSGAWTFLATRLIYIRCGYMSTMAIAEHGLAPIPDADGVQAHATRASSTLDKRKRMPSRMLRSWMS
jgi:hypothetical protein